MLKFKVSSIFTLLKDAAVAWDEDKAWRLGAALAYFTIFSIGPFLIIVIAIAGSIFGQEAAQGEIVNQVQALIGERGARALEVILENAYTSGSSTASTLFSIAVLLFGSTAVFVQLRQAINTIWHVEEKPVGTIKGFLKARLISFIVIIGMGFLLLVSLIVSAGLSAFSKYLNNVFSGLGLILGISDFVISFSVITILFALMFRVLPDARVRLKDVWIGAAVTSLLFVFGKFAIGLYLGNTSIGSTFGAANSLVILMLWTFYSAQIMLYGAEFTKVFANKYGSGIKPLKGAMRVKMEKVPKEGES